MTLVNGDITGMKMRIYHKIIVIPATDILDMAKLETIVPF
jgi:hypothetical protein